MDSASYQTSPSTASGQVPQTPFESPAFPYNQNQSTTWSQPRSLSYGHIEGMHHSYGYHPLSTQQSPQVQSPAFPSYHQLPSNHPAAPSTEAGSSATTQHMQSYPSYQSGWTTYQPNQLTSTHEPNANVFQTQWYSEPSPLTKQVEQISGNTPQYTHAPAYYSNVSHT